MPTIFTYSSRPTPTATRRLSHADLTILTELNTYHYLSATQLCKLLSKKGKLLGTLSTTQTRLKHLWRREYIQRERLPTLGYDGLGPYVYSLHTKGRNTLKAVGQAVIARFRPRESRTHGLFFLPHTLPVNDVLIAAALLARQYPDLVRLDGILHERDLRRKLAVPGLGEFAGKRVSIEPDGWLDIALPTQGVRSPLLLELDRATERRQAWKEKVRRLALLVSPDASGTSPYECFFGRGAFTVAVVTLASQTRRISLQQWTAEALHELNKPHLAQHFLFTNQNPATLTPTAFYGQPHWYAATVNMSPEALLLSGRVGQ